MTLLSNPVVIGSSSTQIYIVPAGTETHLSLSYTNTTASGATVDILFFSASLGTTITLANDLSIAANATENFHDLYMEPGDIVSMSCSAANAVTAFGAAFQADQGPQFTGFTIQGPYVAGTTYATNDVVNDGTSTYVSRINSNTGNTPSSSPAQWMLLAVNGTDGTDGTDGVSPSVTVGSTATGASGTNATVTDSGVAPDVILDFTIPRGADAVIDAATVADMRAGTADKVVEIAIVEAAEDFANIIYATTVIPNHNNFINGEITCTGNITLGNPTNDSPGVLRTILLKGNNTTERTISFGTEYKGSLPTDAVTNTQFVLLTFVPYSTFILTSHLVIDAS